MNEYFFLIGERGLSLLAINAKQLDHQALPERVSIDVSGAYLPLVFVNHGARG